MRARCAAAAMAIAGTLLDPARAQDLESPLEAETPGEAITEGSLLLGVRPRFTWVDQDGRPESAHWGSLRTTLGWKTLSYYGFRATAEAIDVRRFDAHGAIDYRQTPGYIANPPGTPPYAPYTPGYYPLIADPETTDANRLHLDYTGLPETLLRFGRQAVRIDNQRFIGDYDAAQLPQVFDGFSADNQSLRSVRLTGGYFTRVRNAYAVQRQTRLGALNARFEPDRRLKVAAYGYLQNQAQTGSVTGFADNSNRILGARAWGALGVGGGFEFLYTAEAAEQRNYAGGDARIHAPYRRFGAGVAFERGFARVDWEKLGSNGGVYGFQTPLGSTQLFTGRTDVFATTPTAGLRDLRGSLGAKFFKAQVRLDYHRFRSDWNDLSLGREWDVSLSWAFTPALRASMDYADYRAGNPRYAFSDTRKVWATLEYRY
jgi:curved DNA-binding protein CbpA